MTGDKEIFGMNFKIQSPKWEGNSAKFTYGAKMLEEFDNFKKMPD